MAGKELYISGFFVMIFFMGKIFFFVFKGRVKIKEILILDKMNDLIWITLMVMLPLGRAS